MNSKIKRRCPNCSKYYCYLAYQGKTYIPLQLSCGHNICFNCIKNKVKFSEPVECKVCKIELTLSIPDRQMMMIKQNMIFEKFPIDYYLCGQLSAELIPEVSNSKDSVEVSDKYPQDYDIDLKALMEEPNTVDFTTESSKCPIHIDKAIAYYCKDCNMVKCIDCTIIQKSCKYHYIIPFREKSLEMVDELKVLAGVLHENRKHLSTTANQNAILLNKIDQREPSKIIEIIENVQNYFSKLHCTVQKAETKIMCALECSQKHQKESLLQTREEIVTNFKNITNALNLMEGDVMNEGNISDILKMAQNAANLPVFLAIAQDRSDLGLDVNEDIFKKVDDFIKLKGNLDQSYKLSTINNIPEGVIIPPAPKSVMFPPESSIGDVREKISNNSSKSMTDSPTPNLNMKFVPPIINKVYNPDLSSACSSINVREKILHNSSKSTNLKIKKIHNSDQLPSKNAVGNETNEEDVKPLINECKEVVFVSHVVDPHSFYIQRLRQQGILNNMIEEFENASLSPKITKDHIIIGQSYLGYSSVNKRWQRCQVEKVNLNETNTPIFELFYIDYGVTEFATIKNLRHISNQRLCNQPMLAVHCKLANCEPIHGVWKPNDTILMREIVYDKKVMLFVRRDKLEPDGKYPCDVVTLEGDTSVAHALVFHERARQVYQHKKPPTTLQFDKKFNIYNSLNKFSMNSTHEVFITHIVNPDKFYVRKSSLMATYTRLCQEMNVAYKDSSNVVYCPTEDMICVVDCGKMADRDTWWQRAIVRAQLGKQRVNVYLPDTGEVVDVHYTALRCILPKFIKHKALAIECNLSYVMPTKKAWCREAVKLLEGYRDTLLRLQVENYVHDKDSTSVVLHYVSDQNDTSVCINNELVEKYLATANGMPEFIRMSKSISETKSTHRGPTVEQNYNIQNKSKIQMLTKKDDNKKNLKPMDKGPIKREVRILSCPSPSLIYVSLIDQKEIMLELYKQIQNYCFTTKPCYTQWQVDNRCCGFCADSKTWRRAIIKELHGKEATLFFTDFANSEKVSISKIIELPSHLARIDDAAIKCHMSGVVPSVSGDWPSLTKEYLRELIEGYPKIYITKTGIIKDKSLPIEVWVYHKILGGALEPDRKEWRCLNYKIIEEGLGIPDKTHENKDDAQQSKVLLDLACSLNESSKFVESKKEDEVTSEWIPAVPLETVEFSANPVYIDNYGVIYLHNTVQEETLSNLQKILAKINATRGLHTDWHVGEACLAEYSVDKQLYRGRIIKICTDNRYFINYVDYGNEEIRSFENIRKVNELSEELFKIPIMVYRCKLAHVKPPLHECWEPKTLNNIRSYIFGNTCLVRVIGNKVNDLIPIDIRVKDRWLHLYLLDTQQAILDKSERDNSTESLTDSDILVESDSVSLNTMESVDSVDKDMLDESFKHLEMGTIHMFQENIMKKESFTCTILVITNFDTFDLIPGLDTEVQHSYQKIIKDMQLKGDDMPEVNGIYANKACIARFPQQKTWYRASILEYSKALEKVKMKYVDYGNIEIVPLSEVKEIDPKWINPPPITVQAKIYGYVRNSQVDDGVLSEEYVKAFLNKKMLVNVIDTHGSVLLVELRDIIDNTLVYQSLIDNKIFLPWCNFYI